MALPTLGIDLAKDKFDVAFLHHTRFVHKTFSNTVEGITQLLDWLKVQGPPQVHACLVAWSAFTARN